MKHLYIVTFERHINCHMDSMVYHCYASNAKEAVQTARDTWEHEHRAQKKAPHMFYIHAVRCRNTEPLVRDYKGMELRMPRIVDSFVMVDTHVWRYKGSDGQYHYPKMR